jgi:hypothetical protein
MAFGNTLGMIALGQSISAGTYSPPKRKRGRRRKLKPTALGGPFKLRRPRGKPRQYDPVDILRRVDKHKAVAKKQGRRISDARAIGELLHLHAPPKTRRAIDSLVADYRNREADTKFKYEWRALRQAILKVEGPRFATLRDAVSTARQQEKSPK